MKKYVIVEKDIVAKKNIETLMRSFNDVMFSGSSKEQDEALELIFSNKPDIIFLDMDNTLNNLSEFILDLNQHFKNNYSVIALSSEKELAHTAFRYNFFDFLLKPLTRLTLQRSILKYQNKHPERICETICLKSNKDYHYLNTDEILFLKADNNTTDFYMKDETVIGAYKTLKTFENTLPKNFLRIHKSYIVNSYCISRIHYGKSVCIIKNSICNKPIYRIPFTKTFIHNIDLINTSLSKGAFITLS